MGHDMHGGTRSVTTLTAPDRPADRVFDLTAARQRIRVGGQSRIAYTIDGSTPGPILNVTQGDLVEVVLRNRNIPGVALARGRGPDGVAGVTQNAVLPGHHYVYRFVVPDAGTYWYHSHQHARHQVAAGLFGALVVAPRDPVPQAVDVVAALHSYGSSLTINGTASPGPVPADPGTTARIRFINTNNGPLRVAASQRFRVVAIDGTDVQQPTDLDGASVEIPAGGRADLALDIGQTATRVGVVDGPDLVVGPPGTPAPGPLRAVTRFDPLAYGKPDAAVALGAVDRHFKYVIEQRSGYLDGRRGNWYTINGRSLPQVPMYVVHTGDVVRLRYVNRTPVPHPMHLHGHHLRSWPVMGSGLAVGGLRWHSRFPRGKSQRGGFRLPLPMVRPHDRLPDTSTVGSSRTGDECSRASAT